VLKYGVVIFLLAVQIAVLTYCRAYSSFCIFCFFSSVYY